MSRWRRSPLLPADLLVNGRGGTIVDPTSRTARIDVYLALRCGAKRAKCCGRVVWHTVAQGDCVQCAEVFGDVLREKIARLNACKEAGE